MGFWVLGWWNPELYNGVSLVCVCVCVWEFLMQIAQPELCKGIFFWGFAGWGFVNFVQILQRKCRKGHFGDDAPVPKKPREIEGHFRGDEPNSNVMNKLTKKRSSLSLRYLYLAWDPMMALGNLAQKRKLIFQRPKNPHLSRPIL